MDERRKPPAPSDDDEVVFVPETRPSPPRLPQYNRPALGARIPEALEMLAKRLEAVEQQGHAALAAQVNTLTLQRKLALQLNGFGVTINERFDIFHRELAMLRATVTGDHAPRIADMEKKLTPKQAALIGGKYTGVALLLGLVARAAGKVWPQFNETIESVLGVFGL